MEDPPIIQGPRRAVQLVKSGVSLLAAVAIIITGTWGAFYYQASLRLKRAMGAATAAGIPTTLAELLPAPADPEQDASPVYAALSEAYMEIVSQNGRSAEHNAFVGAYLLLHPRSFSHRDTEPARWDKSWTTFEQEVPALRSWMSLSAEVTALLERLPASARSTWARETGPEAWHEWWKHDWGMLAAGRYAGAQGLLALHDGDVRQAVRSFAILSAVDRHYADSPAWNDAATRSGPCSTQLALGALILSTDVPPDVLTAMQESVADPADEETLRRSVAATYIVSRQMAGAILDKDPAIDIRGSRSESAFRYPWSRINIERYFAERWESLVDTWPRLAVPVSNSPYVQLQGETRRRVSASLSGFDLDLPGGLGECANARVYRDLLRLSIAIRRFQIARGAFPQRLSDLVSGGFIKSLPRDAYGGAHYRYVRGEKSVTVYSIGPDMDNDSAVSFAHRWWACDEQGYPTNPPNDDGDIFVTLDAEPAPPWERVALPEWRQRIKDIQAEKAARTKPGKRTARPRKTIE
ncbi:MAG: hypothetical protein JW909_10070 [Planctomycetes bacterium]|nr:hypothetical protein [Planctomycetota bacterium]